MRAIALLIIIAVMLVPALAADEMIAITDELGDRVVLRLMTVEGGAHHWPGGRKARMGEGKTQEIQANEEILRFFAAHP